MMKRIFAVAAVFCVVSGAWAQEAGGQAGPAPSALPAEGAGQPAASSQAESGYDESVPAQVIVFGPRVGAGMSFESAEAFSASVSGAMGAGQEGAVYQPYYSLFGFNLEYRVLLGHTRDHFAIQTLTSIFGLEQSIAIPAAAVIFGYRSHTGVEFGVGPVFNPSGVGVVGAFGYTFSVGGVNIPVDISYQIPNSRLAGALLVSTGFNFNYAVAERY